MYSTIETPLSLSTEQNHTDNKFQYQQYHLNAFTNPQHSTANAITASSSTGGVKNGDNAKSIIITTSSSSNESHTTQPSTLFTHDNRNKFSYGAYINATTISNNNNNSSESNDKKSFNINRTTTMVNDKK